MTPPSQQSDASKPRPPAGEAPTLPGGYHSRGVPGEEGDVRKRMRVLKVGDQSRINKSRPLTGGAGAEQASAARLDAGRPSPTGGGSATAVFVIVKKGTDLLDTPVFRAGESGEEEAVAVFMGRDQAQQYLDHAGWNETDEIGEISPEDLLRWLVEADREGVHYAVVNPDRDRHLAGDPQAILSLDGLGAESANSLHQQVVEVARG